MCLCNIQKNQEDFVHDSILQRDVGLGIIRIGNTMGGNQ